MNDDVSTLKQLIQVVNEMSIRLGSLDNRHPAYFAVNRAWRALCDAKSELGHKPIKKVKLS